MTRSLALEISFNGPGMWYATRATGLVALLLLTLSAVLGVLTSVRFASPKWPRFLTVGLHRNASLLTMVFLGLHVVTTVVDTYTSISVIDVVIPFTSSYRRFWLGLGAIASDLLIALIITSLTRLHLGYRSWRAIHWLAYVSWPIALVHAFGTGTDPSTVWMPMLALLCVGAVLGAFGWRLAAGWPQRKGLRIAAGLGALAMVLSVWGWASSGPLAPGWSKRALSPVSHSSLVRAAS